MNTDELIERIAEKDIDIDAFVHLAIHNESIRAEIVHQMLTHPAIMVYYHCYYVVEKASREHPEIYYPYWNDIAHLLHHANSYHRDFAVEIIGNLTKVDREDRFPAVADEYFSIINDEKFMTGNCCVKNLLKVYRHRSEQRRRIIQTLLEIDERCDYTEKQKAVLKADVLEIFDAVYDVEPARNRINAFIKNELDSISPKTRRKAKQLVRKYRL